MGRERKKKKGGKEKEERKEEKGKRREERKEKKRKRKQRGGEKGALLLHFHFFLFVDIQFCKACIMYHVVGYFILL